MTSNLPEWAGADSVYRRCYALAERMAQNGHVQREKIRGGWRCSISGDLRDLISALNKGDEESLKAALMYARD